MEIPDFSNKNQISKYISFVFVHIVLKNAVQSSDFSDFFDRLNF